MGLLSKLRTTLGLFTLRTPRYAAIPRRAALPAFMRLRRAKARRIPDAGVSALGMRLHAENGELLSYLFYEIFLHEDYAVPLSTTAPVILDVGANIGMSVLYFKRRFPGADITAFEPSPPAFAFLQRNVQSNRLASVTLHNLAVADREGTIDFFLDSAEGSGLRSSTVAARSSGSRAVQVRAVRLSSYITGPVDLLKLDIEGAELGVLRELAAAGKLPLIRRMILEYHHHVRPGDDSLSVFLKLLEDHGFGYTLRADPIDPYTPDEFQDMIIYAYQRAVPASAASPASHPAVTVVATTPSQPVSSAS